MPLLNFFLLISNLVLLQVCGDDAYQFSLSINADPAIAANVKAAIGSECLETDATTVATGDYITIESEWCINFYLFIKRYMQQY